MRGTLRQKGSTVDVIALILAAIAAFIFLVDFIDRRTPPTRWPDLVPLGLLFLTVALICQFTHLSNHVVTNH